MQSETSTTTSTVYSQIANINSSLQNFNNLETNKVSWTFTSSLYNTLINNTSVYLNNDMENYSPVTCTAMLNIVDPTTNKIIMQIPETNQYNLAAYNYTIQDYFNSRIVPARKKYINNYRGKLLRIAPWNATQVSYGTYGDTTIGLLILNIRNLLGIDTGCKVGTINLMQNNNILKTIGNKYSLYNNSGLFNVQSFSWNELFTNNNSYDESLDMNLDFSYPSERVYLFYGSYNTGTNGFNITINPTAWQNIPPTSS